MSHNTLTESFRNRYNVDADNKYAYYKAGVCEICGKYTSQCDAAMLYDGIPVYLCSDKCYAEHWRSLKI